MKALSFKTKVRKVKSSQDELDKLIRYTDNNIQKIEAIATSTEDAKVALAARLYLNDLAGLLGIACEEEG